jgi:ERF superfamily
MQQSETINELAAALAKAQASMRGATKDATNPHFRSRYADLASIWEACRGPLTSNGLTILQAPATIFAGEPLAAQVSVTTRMLHSSGQWLEGTVSAAVKPDPQSIGSAITYLRRYGLASLAGVAPEDDDGEAAMARSDERPQPEPKPVADRPYGVNGSGELFLPGKPASWGGNGGKPLRDVPATVLAAALKWFLEPPETFDADAELLIAGLRDEIKRRDVAESSATKPPLAVVDSEPFREERLRLTLIMKGAPGLYKPADVEAMKAWLAVEGRTIQEVLDRIEDEETRARDWRAESEKGKRRVHV